MIDDKARALVRSWPGISETRPPAGGRRSEACTLLAGQAAEPMVGRAPSLIHSWLLVEHPGPWPRDVLTTELGTLIASLPAGWRVLLIRRSGRRGSVPGRCLVVRDNEEPLEARFADHDELAQADLGEILNRTVAYPGSGRLVLVCTHGRRDACCAEFGRPVLRALQERQDTDVWECTHLGGDRYAGTMLVLPAGLYFSRLDACSASATLDELDRGRLDLASFRGRAGLSQPAQVLEHAARQLGIGDSLEGPDRVQVSEEKDGRVHAQMRLDGVLVSATVGEETTTVPADTVSSCDSDTQGWRHWVLDDFEVGKAAAH